MSGADCESASSGLGFRPLAGALLAATLAAAPLASADVGLPVYRGPEALHAPASAEPAAEAQVVVRPISHQDAESSAAPLSCGDATRLRDVSLDFAPPADQRAEIVANTASPEDAASVPIYIDGETAALKTGKTVNTLEAIMIQGRMVLVSKDENYFNQLQTIRPRDKLLVQTSRSLRQYQVTGAGLTEAGAGSSGELMLAACYPFQPVGRASLLYVVSAQPFPAASPSSPSSLAANQGGGTYETVSF